MLPRAAVRFPAAARIAASIVVVVVLPLVPVTPSQTGASGPRSRQASSGSLYTSSPAASAATASGWCGGKPGDTTTSLTLSSSPAGGSSDAITVAPASRSAAKLGSSTRSKTVTSAPASRSAFADASPAIRAPATSTRFPAYPLMARPVGQY
jgi:hypothetical protein